MGWAKCKYRSGPDRIVEITETFGGAQGLLAVRRRRSFPDEEGTETAERQCIAAYSASSVAEASPMRRGLKPG